ncbi:MAG: DUF3784 domain-containing protein [Clostridia bacterium]|nr:DUF3784 domain-containing protein [Clostridia bacterium]
MLTIKIVTILLGLVFILFGYFIYFKGKYNLINGFEDDYKSGRKDEYYAKKVGLIEFILGFLLLIIAVLLIIFK